ncbi:MFS transporter [Isosphaeraceae bacterium EP7]
MNLATNLPDLDEGPARIRPAGFVRYQVLGMFSILAAITYLDRICMSQAAGPISAELGLDKRQMGWVFSAFTLGYLIFEVPTGWLGDRIGPRRVLTRVVLWWSAFTAVTGLVMGLKSLLLVRFCFGGGEAGAFPNIARALTRWFPTEQRGRAQGTIWTTARIGAAVSLPLTQWMLSLVGWKMTFVIYGLVGLVWAGVFRVWYRDEPADHPDISDEERNWIASWQKEQGTAEADPAGGASWRAILTNPSVLGLCGATACSAFAWYFFATWMPTYLKEARGMTPNSVANLSALPFLAGVLGCALGGWMSDSLVAMMGGTRYARRAVGFIGATMAGVCFLLSLQVKSPIPTVLLMALAGFFNDLPASSLWAAIMDLGERDAGRVAGVVNTASGIGAFLSPILFGELIQLGWGWGIPLTITGIVFLAGGLCWLFVDPSRAISRPGDGFEGIA